MNSVPAHFFIMCDGHCLYDGVLSGLDSMLLMIKTKEFTTIRIAN